MRRLTAVLERARVAPALAGCVQDLTSSSAAAAAARVPRIRFPARLGADGARLSAQHSREGAAAHHGSPAKAAAASHSPAPPAPPAPAPPAPPPAAAAAAAAAAPSLPPGVVAREAPAHTDTAASGMRKIIAARLLESKRGSPHLYVAREATLDALLALRSELKAKGSTASVNDFVVRAAASALARVPAAAALAPGAPIDVAVAVALPGGGLMTPLVAGADRLSLAETSAAIKALAARAREGKLKPEEYSGGAMSVSNLGMFPVSSFSAILNPPQAAILAVGRAESKVVLGGDGAPRTVNVLTVTLTVDQSRVQGADAAAFLQAFCQALEQPATLV